MSRPVGGLEPVLSQSRGRCHSETWPLIIGRIGRSKRAKDEGHTAIATRLQAEQFKQLPSHSCAEPFSAECESPTLELLLLFIECEG